jgi:hypothetical protein
VVKSADVPITEPRCTALFRSTQVCGVNVYVPYRDCAEAARRHTGAGVTVTNYVFICNQDFPHFPVNLLGLSKT